MASWVVPSLAAELWGVSLEEVMSRVEGGDAATKLELGFLLIEVGGCGSKRRDKKATYTRIERSLSRNPQRPQTFRAVERDARSWSERRAMAGKLRRRV